MTIPKDPVSSNTGAATPPSALYRHTIGRLSCALRIPVFAIGTALQLSKIALKLLIAPVFTCLDNAKAKPSERKFSDLTFRAVAKDAAMLIPLLECLASAIKGTIVAPSIHYKSLAEATQATAELVFVAQYNRNQVEVNQVEVEVKKIQLDPKTLEPMPMAPKPLFNHVHLVDLTVNDLFDCQNQTSMKYVSEISPDIFNHGYPLRICNENHET